MDQAFVVNLGRQAMLTILLVGAPILGLGLLVGLLVSVFQATTQINEQTLTFVPKIVAVLAAIIFFGPWMLTVMLEYTQNLLSNIPVHIR